MFGNHFVERSLVVYFDKAEAHYSTTEVTVMRQADRQTDRHTDRQTSLSSPLHSPLSSSPFLFFFFLFFFLFLSGSTSFLPSSLLPSPPSPPSLSSIPLLLPSSCLPPPAFFSLLPPPLSSFPLLPSQASNPYDELMHVVKWHGLNACMVLEPSPGYDGPIGEE